MSALDDLGPLQRPLLLAGRALLGIYFIIPGISKVTGFASTSAYMTEALDMGAEMFDWANKRVKPTRH